MSETGTGELRLAEHIVRFARALRATGMKVGPGAAVDAVKAVETAGAARRDDFYWTLHAVLVKRYEDRPVFDEAFRLFWRRRDPNEAILAALLPPAPETAKERPAQRRNKEWSRRVLAQGVIVLLITDGLEREAGDALSREMDRLHRSCRRLIWLNPLLRFEGFEAKAHGIRAMLPHADEFRPVHNLASLEALCAALDAQQLGTMRHATHSGV